MAHRVVVQLVHDIDGREIEDGDGGTVTFALDQVQFDRTQHGDELRAALQPYIANARKVRASRRRRTSSK